MNDAPTLVLADSTVAIASSNGNITFSSGNSNAITVADVEGDDLTVDLIAFGGTMDVTDGSGVTFNNATMQNAAQATVSMTGTAAQINAALSGMVFTADGAADASIMVSVADAALFAADVVEIQVAASDTPQTFNFATAGSDSVVAYDETIPVFISGTSAAATTVALSVADTTIADTDYTLTFTNFNAFTAALDGTSIQFADGSLLKTAASASTLVGGALNDQLIGSTGVDTLRGYAGDDKLYGGLGADTIFGGAGNDLIYVGDSSATDNAADVLQYTQASEGNDIVVGFKSNDRFDLGSTADVASVTASGSNTIVALSGGTYVTLVGFSGVDLAAFQTSYVI